MTSTHQISAAVLDRPDHVSELLISDARHEREPQLTGGQLLEVAAAANALTLALALAGDDGGVDQAHERAVLAARSAPDAGHSLAAMAAADAQGRQQARDQLPGELVRKVRRNRQARTGGER